MKEVTDHNSLFFCFLPSADVQGSVGDFELKALRCRSDQEDMIPTFMVFLMEFSISPWFLK